MDHVQQEKSWVAPLERHRARRADGVPTVSVLVGEHEAGRRMFERASLPGSPVVLEAAELEAVAKAWVDEAIASAGLRDQAVERLAKHHAVPVLELRSWLDQRTPRQREDLIARATAALEAPEGLLARILWEGPPDASPTPESIASVRWIAAALAPLPPLLLVVADDDAARAAETASLLAEATPASDVALALTPSAMPPLREAVSQATWSRLAEGLVHLRHVRSDSASTIRAVKDGARASYRPTPPRADRADRAASTIPAPPRIPSSGSAPSAPPDPPDTEHEYPTAPVIHFDERVLAQSSAERLLYQELQRRPKTRDRFALSRSIQVGKDDRALAVDFLCEELAVALMVDGSHHFESVDAYRQERERDRLLQEQGLRVVRVLADDVHRELAYVIAVIESTLAERQARSG